jgi:transposase
VRAHAPQLRAQVLAECDRPGASVAKVALSHGLNANLVHKWRRDKREGGGSTGGVQASCVEFIGLPLAPPTPAPIAEVAADIRLELRRGATTISISWPVAAGAECAAWLAQWLR